MTEKRPATASRGMVVTNHPLGGHRVVAVPGVAGGMNAVAFAGDGMLEGAACWRADGTPIGVSGGLARAGIRFRPDANRRPG